MIRLQRLMVHERPLRLYLMWMIISAVCSYSHVLHARSDWGDSAYKNWTTASLTIEGLDKKTASELKKGLALARPTGFLKTRRPTLFPQTLDDDIKRSLLFLARRGYPYATVTPRFIPKPRRKRVELILEVNRGPAVRIAALTLRGIPPDIEEDARESLLAKTDSVVVDKELEQSKAALISLLTNNGYARANVESHVEFKDSTHVTIRFDAQPGMMYYFGDVIVAGASEDVVPLTRKVVPVRKGNKYDPKALDDSQKDLRLLDLFKRIRVGVQDAAIDTLDVVVDVTMKEPRRLETNLRYWTDEQIDGSVSWKHRNLFKRGRGGSALASASFIRQKLQFSAWWPAILLARNRGTITMSVENEIEESYELLSVGGSIGMNYDFSLLTRARVALVFSNIDITEKTPDADVIEAQDGMLNSIQLRWERNAGNRPIVPTSGTYTYVELEWAPDGPLNDYRFASLSPTAIIYVPLSPSHEWVLATRLTVGLAKPTGKTTDLLPNKRFYSGGATSMRGFKRRKLGPLDSNGAPLGGEAKMEAAMELRIPLFSRFRGTWFLDTGQVWPTLDDMVFDNFEVATGLGLWINTLIGPIRGDLAYRLTYFEKTQPRWVFHFSIGPAF
jgi:outer membrane protein insertion porin family